MRGLFRQLQPFSCILRTGLLFFISMCFVTFSLTKAVVQFGKPTKNYPGFWGPVTASIDWCESNYAVTYYIAEFFNAISNIFPIVSGIFLSLKAKRLNVGAQYVYSALCLCLVGLGSFLFHGTLLFQAQMLDELPMIYMQLICLYISIQTECRRSLPRLKWVFVLFALVYSILHISQRFVITFHVVFGCILLPSFFYPLKFTAGDKFVQRNQLYCYGMFFISFLAWVSYDFCLILFIFIFIFIFIFPLFSHIKYIHRQRENLSLPIMLKN
ncbi:Alkaline ceramidase 3 [Coelomomyces lativittatus]|nr:Alkaline ceramidase 3 [Coelomomyces lativittatus]